MSASAASSSAASIPAAINDSKDDRQEQVSDIIDDTTDSNNDGMSDDEGSNDEDGESEADVFFRDAWDITNRTSHRQFCSFLSLQKEIVKMVWGMLGEGSLHPEKSKPKHLLWALYVLKVYPQGKAPDTPLLVGLRVPLTLRPCRNGFGSF
jgi:hypothetical protein